MTARAARSRLQVSFVKTGANTWAYEVTYPGAASNYRPPANNLIASGTMTFNSDGTLQDGRHLGRGRRRVRSTSPFPGLPASPASIRRPSRINMGTPGASDGITQFDNPSALASVVGRRRAVRQL